MGGAFLLYTLSDFSPVVQLVGELVDKWSSFPETQHTPLCAHLLGLAMKTVSQLALGESFSQDAQVVSFRKNHDAVSQDPEGTSIELLDSEAAAAPADLVRDREGIPGRLPGEELQQEGTLPERLGGAGETGEG